MNDVGNVAGPKKTTLRLAHSKEAPVVGIQIDKNAVNQTAGEICRRLNTVFRDVKSMQFYLAATADADLIALGFTQGEVNIIKSAFTDLNTLATVYEGTATQGTLKDFRAFARQLFGVGFPS